MMKKFLISILLCFAAVSTAMAATPGEVPEGGVLREVLMRGLTGEPRTLSSFRGKPLIINMWASYCSPCLQEMGSLERLATRYGKQFNVIGVSIDDYTDRANTFLGMVKTTFPHFIDNKLTIENMLGANRIPLTVLVDAQGRILHKVYGAKEWDSPEAVRAISQAFGIPM
jgi:thiol-disulfide isomerase/thioredoxin